MKEKNCCICKQLMFYRKEILFITARMKFLTFHFSHKSSDECFAKLILSWAKLEFNFLWLKLFYIFQADVTLDNSKGEFEFASASNEVIVPTEMTKTVEVLIVLLIIHYHSFYQSLKNLVTNKIRYLSRSRLKMELLLNSSSLRKN